MAGFFTPEQIEILSASTVRVATLAELAFASGTMRLFAGAGVRDFGGQEWRGLGGLISIDGLGDMRTTQANTVSITLSGVDEATLPKAIGEPEEVVDRLIVIYWQFLDSGMQPVGSLVPIYFGLMQSPSIDRSEASDDEGAVCTISLPCEGLFVGRSKPPRGRYTDRDQQARHPGDRIFDRMSENRGKVVLWPDFD
ncbi:hypothetical protein [Aureimonas glaciei]|uniref:Uncharacterized protein n=1 Tax=Aureimonas glaciei TaxID=1776957 RepID=A0A916XZR7_9HYPH|nr:hypothetical protein [Aureimonas glaciei]GGD24402.1 hypothetical protein GCM10011335_29130 [Aureimonas glaciei]